MALTQKQRSQTILAIRFKNPDELRLIRRLAKKDKVSVNSLCRAAIVIYAEAMKARLEKV